MFGHIYSVIDFEDYANQLMGVSAKDLCLLSTEPTLIVEIAQNICNKQFIFTLSVSVEIEPSDRLILLTTINN